MASAVSWAASPSRSLTTTLAPCSDSSSAVALPMPRALPVTIATLSSRTPMHDLLVGLSGNRRSYWLIGQSVGLAVVAHRAMTGMETTIAAPHLARRVRVLGDSARVAAPARHEAAREQRDGGGRAAAGEGHIGGAAARSRARDPGRRVLDRDGRRLAHRAELLGRVRAQAA